LHSNDASNGFYVGIGSEFSTSQPLALKVEYRYDRNWEMKSRDYAGAAPISARTGDIHNHNIFLMATYHPFSSKYQPKNMASNNMTFGGMYSTLFTGYGGARLAGFVDTSQLPGGPQQTERLGSSYEKAAFLGTSLGYNFIQPNIYDRYPLVYGVEVDLVRLPLYSKDACDSSCNDFIRHSMKTQGSIRGKVGTVIHNNNLIFATLGAGLVRSKLEAFDDVDSPTSSEYGEKSFISANLLLGAGAEHMFTDKFGLMLTGLYSGAATSYKFDRDQLTGDMDQGDYAQVRGTFQARLGATYYF
jgi:opacity protein-like surface antigen